MVHYDWPLYQTRWATFDVDLDARSKTCRLQHVLRPRGGYYDGRWPLNGNHGSLGYPQYDRWVDHVQRHLHTVLTGLCQEPGIGNLTLEDFERLVPEVPGC